MKIPWLVSAGFEQPAGVYLQAGTRTRTRSRTSSGICEKIFLGHSVENFDVVCTSYGKFSGVWHWLKTTIVTIYIYDISAIKRGNWTIGHP